MPMIKANNAEFYYQSIGYGQPIIFISGYTSDHTVWLETIEFLKDYYQCIVFDNRGIGRTIDDAPELTAELMAADVIAIAKALNLEKPHIAGSSMGGTIAQVIAHQHADQVSKVVLLSTSPKWRAATLQGLWLQVAMRQAGVNDDLVFDALIPWVFSERFLNDEKNIQTLKELAAANAYPQSLDNQIRQFNVLTQFNSLDWLPEIKAPVFIMHGDEDIISLPIEAEYMAEEIPNAQAVWFEDAAHSLMGEQPDGTAEALKVFFD
jgi:pimeloyl-ACP methyl ester carboxylesterase